MITLEWHPFPKEKPEHTRNYLVTYKCGKTREGKCNYLVAIFNWNGRNWQTNDMRGMPTKMTEAVIAWMEIPEPYDIEE